MKTIITILLLFFACSFSNAQIFGSNDVCAGYTYSYTATIPGAVTYSWSFRPGWYDLSGQGTGSVTVTCNENVGDIYCEGIDAGGNSITTLVLVTQFGGGAAVGWDVQPQNSGGCAGMQYTLNIVPNGSGGGSCPNGCGNGIPVASVGYAVYDDVWPNGSFTGFADGSFLSYPLTPGTYSYYIYYVDYTNGTSTSQAVQIEGGCGSATVDNTVQLTIMTPMLAAFSQGPDPVCIGDTVTVWETLGFTNESFSPIMGITILSQSGGFMTAVVNSIPARANYVGTDWNGCVSADICYINAIGCTTSLTGDTTVCAGHTYSYSINIPGAVTYDWLLPTGWYGITGQGTASITATCNINAGWIIVTGHDALGNIIGVEDILTQFGGGGNVGWDVSPAAVASCDANASPFSVTITPNGTGGGAGCPAGCGLGSLHPNIGFAVYNNVWPLGSFIQNADGISPIAPPGFNTTYYVYYVDITNGLNPPLAVLIEGGCGGGVVNNAITLTVIYPVIPTISSTPNPACVGDTITVSQFDVINPWWNISSGGTLLNNNINSIDVIVTGIPCSIYLEGIDINTSCFVATNFSPPVINCLSGSITGDTILCAGYIYNYSASIAGAVSYIWTFPTGWYGITGQGTTNVTATCNVNDGNICVEGFDAGGNSLGTECIVTEFGGGGFTGWDVQPTSVSGCNGAPFSLSVVPNGTGGGPGCPPGCGNGTLHPNIVYGIYSGVWPTSFYYGNADGVTSFILGGFGQPSGIVYVYLVDITNGVDPPQAIRIEGGCGSGVVNNTCNITPWIPNPPLVSQIPMPACIGDTVQLLEVTGLTNVGWGFIGGNDLTFVSGQFSNPLIAVVTGNNPYTDVTGIDANGCMTYLSPVGVALGTCALPSAQFASSDTVFCDKQSINFTDLSTNTPTSWQWFFPGALPDTSTAQNPQGIYYPTNGSFNVTLIACNAAGCDTITLNNFIVEYQTPTDSIFELNDTLFSFPAITYQWYEVGTGLIAGATNQYYVPLQNGNYYCQITDSVGCSGPSNTIAITTGINSISNFNFPISITPNPNNGIFSLELNSASKIRNLKTQIINVLGEIVFEKDLENMNGKFSEQINLSIQPKGIYVLKLMSDEKVFSQKIILN